MHGQRDGVADLGVAAYGAGNRDRLGFFGGVDHIITSDGVDGDGGLGFQVDAVRTVSRGRRRVAGRVGDGDGGVDVGVLRQFRAGHVDAVAELAAALVHDLTGVGLAMHGQGHGVADLGVAAYGARDRDRLGLFGGVDHIITSDGVDGDGGLGFQVDAIALVSFGGLAVASVIGSGHGGVDIAVLSQLCARHVDAVAELAAALVHDLTGIGLAMHGQGDGVADLDVAADLAGHGDILARFFGVDDAVAGDRVDRDRGVNVGVDAVALISFGSLAVAGIIRGGHGSVDVRVLGEFRTRNIDAVAQGTVAQVHNLTGVVLAVDGQGDGVADLDVTADLAGHGNVLARFFSVDDAVARDRVDRDRSVNVGVDAVALIGFSGLAVAGVIGRRDGGVDIAVLSQLRTRNIDAVAQGTVTQIHDLTGVVLAVDGQGDGVADLDVAADLTGHGNILARFFSVHHAVAGDGVDRDRSIDLGVDAVTLVGFGGLRITRIVRSGHGCVDIAVLSQLGTRHVDAVAQGTVTQVDNLAGVVLTIDRQGDGVAHLDVATDLTGDGNVLAGFFGVHHAVARDRIDRDRGVNVGVDAVALIGFSGLAVAGVIGRRDGGVDIAVLGQLGARHVDAVAQGTVAQIHDLTGVVLTIDRQGDGVADLDVATDLTSDGDVLAGFFGVHHAVARDRIDRDRGVNH
ncbi:hypothetical protein LMG26219_06324 [Achromobacter marplatensis]|nr:hypothetical protein LMG26219_06324 [Achromobacter marplatensis]